ncbi:uncharacterized protein B4U79_12341 [Dinothrombium tinctorium]|uniref:Uncharacterized protein n=1 Tax=Dinothrombium tinctorium TaxID=1965070 RepID=A0A3S3RWF2_9ACAR|nr:uncharacterized protein B4U79_10803 [Dinothrombium tinctorium]RWS05770.1 uncharacterized protein B4U79_12341 [Dinothrombium tinctorium]
MCSSQDGHIYLIGGRSGNLPLKDLWRFDSERSQWEEIKTKGQQPPNLQEHTMIEWNNKLYVFGGEIGVSSNGDTPLWILDLATLTWRKYVSSPTNLHPGASGMQPTGRRGHTAVLYGDAMHIYGGYQDLKGSTSELWTFDLSFEEWHLMSCSGRLAEQPSPRHSHSAIIYDNCLWIYGGMTDLQEKGDFWKWDFGTRQWTKIKTKVNPGGLHSHTAIKAFGSMFIFGGERGNTLLQDLWRFDFATELWEKMQTEGMIPNPRCRHTAVANPSLDTSLWDRDHYEDDHRILNSHSKPNCLQKINSKAVILAPPKSISMCFGQHTDSPLHEATAKSLKYFKFKVHPMSLNICSRGIDTISDDDGEIEDVNGNGKHYNHNSSQGNVRKSLKEKITHSRLVRSISTSSYNILHNQNSSGTEPLKDELEKLVEESTPQMPRPNAFKMINPPSFVPKQEGSYHRMRNKMQKSQSSDAVLESDSESSTPQNIRKPRPRSEVIQANSSVSVGGSPSTPNENAINNNSISSNLNSRPNSQHRLSSGYEGHFISALQDFEEEDDDEVNENSEPVDRGNGNRNTTLIELDDNCNGIIVSPTDARPKSSGYNSLVTLCTPNVESHGIPHSISHSSGYHSFADESMYDHKDVAIFQPNPVIRRNRNTRDLGSSIELKQMNGRLRDCNINQNIISENALQKKTQKENRTRSLDRTCLRNNGNNRLNSAKLEKSRQIPIIKEVVVPNSPATRKWAYSPAKNRLHQHHWKLCMFVFGGREQGVSPVYKQPISVWKLYI